MLTPMQSMYARGEAGDPLPAVFETLDKAGIKFRRSQFALICAGPGTGKSAFILTIAAKSELPTLYFSADSDSWTQLTRLVSIQTGLTLQESAELVRSGNLGDVADELDVPIRLNYQASPTLDQIKLSMDAYAEVYNEYPSLVVIDNITNVRAGGKNDEDPFQGLEVLTEYLHTLARETDACVIGLHHVTGTYNDSNKAIPLSGVKGQIGRVPELILTMYRIPGRFGGSDTLRVSTVKNRAGKADASGKSYVDLEFIGDSMTIRDFT